jgi:hypothetical protein
MSVGTLLAGLSLALFVLLAIAFTLLLRRAARIVAANREDDTFRREGAALADRAVTVITSASESIDGVRRRISAPAALDEVLPGLLESLETIRAAADALIPPAVMAAIRARMAEEIDRAMRSIESVQHGCVLLGVADGRLGEREGETAVKRGYLNLLHAREALESLAVGLRSGSLAAGGPHGDGPRRG